MFDCEFCKKEFTMKVNLISHQKTAKYCLEIQGKNINNNSNFTCDYCNKTFTLKHILIDHISVCKQKKEVENRDIDQSGITNIVSVRKLRVDKGDDIDQFGLTNKDHNDEIKKIKDDCEIKHKKDIEKYDMKIELLTQMISKLESKLESYEKRLFDMASNPNTTHTNNKTVVIKDMNDKTPLTVDEKMQCALLINELAKQQEIEDNKETVQETKLIINEVTVTSRKNYIKNIIRNSMIGTDLNILNS